MIILDIETTGTDPHRNCMVSLGAIDYETGKEFYGECSIYRDSLVDPLAMEINGFNIDQIRPGVKQEAHCLYYEFNDWAGQFPDKLLAGHNVGHLDLPFLEHLHETSFNFDWAFGYRTVDLHSLAYLVFGQSLKLSAICEKLGVPPEPKPHNALNGARVTRECFYGICQLVRYNLKPDWAQLAAEWAASKKPTK